MQSQPIPEVNWNDVERIVRRDFPASQVAEIIVILKEYGKSKRQREAARIQVAVLKLAHGNIERLRMHIKAASADSRDVLAAAESPEYFKRGSGVEALSAKEHSQIIESDWKQYKDWLQPK